MSVQRAKTSGRQVQLISNFFEFSKLPIEAVYGYFIDFTPEVHITNKDLQKFLVRGVRSQITELLGSHFYYDYIISSTKREEPFSAISKGRDSSEYTLSFRYIGAIEPDSLRFCWYLNILIKLQQKSLGLKQLTNNPTFFNPDQAVELDHIGLSIWNGYKATVNSVGSRVLLSLDICSKIINKKNVLEAIEEVRDKNPDLRRKRILNLLQNQIIMTRYNKRFYRIMDVDFEANPTSTFQTKEGDISFRDYVLKQYQIKITDNRQPLLIALQRKQELKLVPELCFLTGVPEAARRNGNVMREVRDANKSNPVDRFAAITQHAARMTAQGRELSERQNLILEPDPIRITATEFNPVKIQFKTEAVDCTDRGFSIRSAVKNSSPIRLLRICYTANDYNNAGFLENSLQNKMRSNKIPLEQIDFFEYTTGPHLCQHLESLRNAPSAPTILVVILQRRDKIYDEVKQASNSCEFVVQCMLSSQFGNDRKIESVLTNVAHQIAAKTGSQLWTIPHLEGIPRITMVVGMDVYHDTVNKRESILAFCASVNPEFTKYYSTIRKQGKVGEEISTSAEGCFNEALLAFFEETKQRFLPSLIVVFRDGVGDTQHDLVKDIEIAGLRRVISNFQGYKPEIVYTVVIKRIDQRFFEIFKGTASNPRAGTYICDSRVCDEKTFYLIPNAVTQGTATPVKYKIIENSSSVDRDTLARFAFGLCHLYYNWKGSVKLPCPTQLSHKLAYIVGESIHADASNRLKTKLWFL